MSGGEARPGGAEPPRPNQATRPGTAEPFRSPGPDPARFADLLTGYCLEVQDGQQVLVRSTTLAAPLLSELQRAILARGGWPLLRIELPGETEAFFAHAQEEHLDGFPAVALAEIEGVDA